MELLVRKADGYGTFSDFLKTLMNGAINRKGLSVVRLAHCSLKHVDRYRY
jgi:hypothetical protein